MCCLLFSLILVYDGTTMLPGGPAAVRRSSMTQSTEAAQPRAVVVQDLSCVGRCSLTVALPGAFERRGREHAAVIPTALLSTHTGEFTGYTHLDLSGQLLAHRARISPRLGLHFDAFYYGGYLASGAQVEQVLAMLDLLCDAGIPTSLWTRPSPTTGRRYSLLDSGHARPDAPPVRPRAAPSRPT